MKQQAVLERESGSAAIKENMYPLAALYGYKSDSNPYYKDKRLLEIIMKAGDALIEDADDIGKWEFRKKDGSTWGPIHMPWTYSRWIRSYSQIHEDMPSDPQTGMDRCAKRLGIPVSPKVNFIAFIIFPPIMPWGSTSPGRY